MTLDLPDNLLQDLSEFILSHTGLYFPKKKWRALNKGIKSAAHELGYEIQNFANQLLTTPPTKKTINTLISYLTIGETYFLRDKNLFQILGDQIIRGLIHRPRKKNKKINFWSAGCSSGEEPYSIAILIDQLFPRLNGWDIAILGTDINPASIEKAKKGIYTHWSFRETPKKIIQNYFTQTSNNQFEIVPHIKTKVKFSQINLMEKDYVLHPDISGAVDVIICRNVLMYFNDQNRDIAIQTLSRFLAEDGWLITAPAESGFIQVPGLSPVKFPNAIFHKKGNPRKNDRHTFVSDIKPDTQRIKPNPPKPVKTVKKYKPLARRISDLLPSDKLDYDVYLTSVQDYKNGDYVKTVEKLSGLLSDELNNNAFLMKTDAMVLLSRSYANIGKVENARYWCEKAIDSEKLNPEIYYLLSTILQTDGDIKASIRSLKQALYLDPEFIMAHFTLGLLLQQEKKLYESQKSMANALSLLKAKDPDEVLTYSDGMTSGLLINTISGIINNMWDF